MADRFFMMNMGETPQNLWLADLWLQYRDRLLRLLALRMPAVLQRRLSVEDLLQETYLACGRRAAYLQAEPEVPMYVKLRRIALQTLLLRAHHTGILQDTGHQDDQNDHSCHKHNDQEHDAHRQPDILHRLFILNRSRRRRSLCGNGGRGNGRHRRRRRDHLGQANGNGRADVIDVDTRTLVCEAFCRTITNAGYKAGVYASRNWYNNNLKAERLEDYYIWMAEYRSTPLSQGYYNMWQYTSKGQIDGIKGNVDLNIAYE